MDQKSEIKKGAKSGLIGGTLAALCCIGPLVIVLFGLGSVSFALSIGKYKPYFLGLGFLFMIFAIVLHLRKKNKTCDINCFSVNGIKREWSFIVSIAISMGITYVLALYVIVPAISPTVYSNAISKTTVIQLSPSQNFEQICRDTGDQWMKMIPIKDGRVTSELECFGCMPDEKNHICNLNEYLTFDRTSDAKATGNSADHDIVNTNSDLNLRTLTLKINELTCISCADIVEDVLLGQDGISVTKVDYAKGMGEVTYDPDIISKEEILENWVFSVYPAEIIGEELAG